MSEQIAYVGDTSGDEILDVSFYEKTVGEKTVDYIKIKVPGDNTVAITSPVTENYKRRFARKWEAYKNMQAIDTGTPLSEWDEMTEGLCREFAYQGFRYIEQIAGAPDSAFSRIQGGFQWRNRAQAFLNRGKKSSQEVISQQQNEIETLKQQMAELMAAVGGAKRGRKSKESTQTETDEVESEE
jgi:hypothetical protein